MLITGESGTGKEVLARHIHRASRRAAGPFVALNCAAIPENLLESEMFGHEKGAFSGAVARRVGKFEAADGGTLLLDEISEMDVRLQAKLLRAIQEREIDRLGGTGPVRVNVRILATSNRDLLADCTAGRFREDLYFRLNVVSLRIPPLRERPGDIAALADHYARHYAGVNGLAGAADLRGWPTCGWSRMAGAATCGSWRTRFTAPCCSPRGSRSTPSSYPAAAAAPVKVRRRWAGVAGLVGRTMDAVEQDLILQTLSHTLGNRTHAATILGISIRALRNKLRDYRRVWRGRDATRAWRR